MTSTGKLAAAIALLTGHHATLSAAAPGLGDASRTLIDAWNRRALATPDGEGREVKDFLAAHIAEQLAENDGFWRSCSGCYETNEGYPTAPSDRVFKCELGGGCSECGGIGAIWDTVDYAAMGAELAAKPHALSKADACLAALASRGGGERIGWLFGDDDYPITFSRNHPVESGEDPFATDIKPATAENLLEALNDAWANEAEARDAASPAPLAPDLGGEAVAPEVVERITVALDLLDDARCGAISHSPEAVDWQAKRDDIDLIALRASVRALLASRAPGLKNG